MPRFHSVESACTYLLFNPPTKLKSVQLEHDRKTPDRVGVYVGDEMVAEGPAALYSALKARIEDALEGYRRGSERDRTKALVFQHYYLTPRWEQAHIDEVAVKVGASSRTIRRWLAEVREDVERALLALGVLEHERD